MMDKRFLLLVFIGVALTPVVATAADCRDYIVAAERAHSVPAVLLSAVAYVESGMDSLAINADGSSYHPSSLDEAVHLVRELQRSGAVYIDVGCMQIDLRYHPDAFADLHAAFDPSLNTAYGARYLKDNWRRYGSWTQAVAYYHSGDPQKQAEYVSRVKARLTGAMLPSPHYVSAKTAVGPKMVTVRLSMMTIRRPIAGSVVARGQ